MSIALLQLVETRLARHRPVRPRLRPLMKRSSVALVLSVREGELHVLMIRRAEREGDPWSGHMAFPGGRRDPEDAHGYAVALRETEEEVGLDLEQHARFIGRLSDIAARRKKLEIGMAVSVFVFRLEREVPLSPNHEVAEPVWIPIEFLLDEANRGSMIWERRGLRVRLPCYDFEGRRIWGMSLRMLDELLGLVRHEQSDRGPA